TKTNAAVPGKLIVAVKICGAVISGHQQIEIAVTIKVAVGQAATNFGLAEATTDFSSYIVKDSFAIVQKKLRRLRIADSANVKHSVINVTIHHGKVERAVEIGIEKYAAESQSIF